MDAARAERDLAVSRVHSQNGFIQEEMELKKLEGQRQKNRDTKNELNELGHELRSMELEWRADDRYTLQTCNKRCKWSFINDNL